jgi:hypothetical protein
VLRSSRLDGGSNQAACLRATAMLLGTCGRGVHRRRRLRPRCSPVASPAVLCPMQSCAPCSAAASPTWPHTTCELPHSGWSAVAMKKSLLPGMMQALPFLRGQVGSRHVSRGTSTSGGVLRSSSPAGFGNRHFSTPHDHMCRRLLLLLCCKHLALQVREPLDQSGHLRLPALPASPDHSQCGGLPGRGLRQLVHTALQQRVGRSPEVVLAPILQAACRLHHHVLGRGRGQQVAVQTELGMARFAHSWAA